MHLLLLQKYINFKRLFASLKPIFYILLVTYSMELTMTISRRSFIKSSAATTAVVLSGGIANQVVEAATISSSMSPGPGNKWPGRVAINFNKLALVGSTPNVDVIKKMIDDAILALTGKQTTGAAWKEVFPAELSTKSKIAIKVNTANTSLPGPHWASVRAITDGLQQMDINGSKFPGANIIIYDMNFSEGMPKMGYKQENFPGVTLAYTKLVDGGDGAMNNHKYSETLKNADYLINVFSPRGHTYPPVGSRFTLGFKSHIGTYASEAAKEGPSLHADLMQNLREMNCTGVVFKKNVLSVCSGIAALNEGSGPPGEAQDYQKYAKTMDASISGAASSTTMILSTDPIAIEMQAIKMMRLNKGGKYDVESLPPYLQACAGISGKMDGKVYNIGIIDEKQMDIRRIINGITSIERFENQAKKIVQGDVKISSVKGTGTTFFEFTLPEVQSGSEAAIIIHSLDGKVVYKQVMGLGGVVNHFSWEHRTINGKKVGNGIFIVQITSGKSQLSKRFSIV
jgi:hypothetical protein